MIDQPPSLNRGMLEQWLYVLHGDCPGWSVVSSNLDWSGRAFKVSGNGWSDKLVSYVTELDRRGAKGIYLRVTSISSEPEQGRRGRDEDSAALPALWLDMDIAGPGHKPIRTLPGRPPALPLPPDEETCRKIVDKSGLPEPTLWIHSGGGLYPYWFFTQPIKLNTPELLEHWTDVSQRFHDIAASAATDLGFHYGTGTHDMSRVLRLPGTVNRKVDGAPTQARTFDEFMGQGATYFPDQLDLPALPDHSPHVPEVIRVTTPVPSSPPSSVPRSDGLKPGEDYNLRGDVLGDVLFPNGWETHSLDRGELLLTRPGKDRRDGHSASWGYQGSRNLYVWSSDAGLPTNEPLSAFYLYAQYNHGGDFKAAAKDLATQGFGDPLAPSTPFPGLTSAPRSATTVVASPSKGVPPVSSGGGDVPPPSLPPPVIQPAASDDDVKFIDVTDDTIATHAVLAMLGRGQLHSLYKMHGKLVYAPCEEGDQHRVESGDGIVTLNAYAFRAHIGKYYPPYRKGKDGEWKRSVYSVTLANTVFAGLHLASNLRPLKGVSRLPIARPDGTIWDTVGYDSQTQYIYLPDPTLKLPPIPAKPTVEEMGKAKALIDFMLVDFPWVSTGDRNNFLGFLLTPLLTRVVDTPFKLGVIGAHQPGSGKTLLVKLLHILHGGAIMPPMSGGEDELRKLITSNLLNTHESLSSWDNVTGRLSSSALDALLTSRTWKDRILGRSGTQEMFNDRLWLVTGNNIQVGSDLNRRTVWSYINPNMPSPENRNNFKISDLMGWAKKNRGALLWSLYTVIQGWVAAGKPVRCDKSDMFCGWVGTVNGILDTAGWEGSFDTQESRQQATSSTDEEWTDLFESIAERFGEEEWTVSQLMALVNPQASDLVHSLTNMAKPWSTDILPVAVARDLQQGNTAMAGRTLGVRLKGIEGRFIGGLKVIQNPQRTRHGYRWHLVRYVEVTSPSNVLPSDGQPELPGPALLHDAELPELPVGAHVPVQHAELSPPDWVGTSPVPPVPSEPSAADLPDGLDELGPYDSSPLGLASPPGDPDISPPLTRGEGTELQ